MINRKLNINVYSSANKVAGQGVGSAYLEQVNLIEKGASDLFDVSINDWSRKPDIQHFHTIDPSFFLKMQDHNAVNVAYCHFLPDTVTDGSLKIPAPFNHLVGKYIIEFYKSADYIVVVNPSFIKKLVAYGIPQERIVYVPNYVSKEKFHPLGMEKRNETRRKYGIEEQAFVVLGAGQAQTRKGIFDFVEVAEKNPQMQFIWVGGFSFGKMTDGYEEVKKIMENPPANVKFPGIISRDEMVDIYNMTDVLFIPSYHELFPMIILEAANLAVPMVIRDLDLYHDILFDHYLKGNDNTEFSQLLTKLHTDSVFYHEAQEESKKISEFYSAEHVLQLWKDFYLSIYEQKHQDKK